MDDILFGTLTLMFWASTAAFIRGLSESKHEKLITFLYFTFAFIYIISTYYAGATYGK